MSVSLPSLCGLPISAWGRETEPGGDESGVSLCGRKRTDGTYPAGFVSKERRDRCESQTSA